MAELIKRTDSYTTQEPPCTMPQALTSSQESPAEELTEFKGTTTFQPSASTYRYSMTVKGDYLRVWIENCETKEQWCSDNLGLEDYVNFTNAIPNALASDYVEVKSTISACISVTELPPFMIPDIIRSLSFMNAYGTLS
ncbi:hypothetical protein DVH05_004394 [Phytophthora capsici]|nr:hypothetical protein DVH05_004394 [Phytophthora capsici]